LKWQIAVNTEVDLVLFDINVICLSPRIFSALDSHDFHVICLSPRIFSALDSHDFHVICLSPRIFSAQIM